MNDPLNHSNPTPGLYEQVITRGLRELIEGWRENGWSVDEALISEEDSDRVLARYVGRAIEAHLADMSHLERVMAINLILQQLETAEVPHQRALAVEEKPRHLRHLAPAEGSTPPARASTPMDQVGLLTNDPADTALCKDLRVELPTADRVDLLCAFVKWSGLRLIEEELKAAAERDVPIRVLTTTYMGATEARALNRLVREFGAQVKINYETNSTRLHAKAWLFRRNTGCDTAYVGSSNLSKPALLEGLEWNIRLSAVASPEALQKFETTFDTYWNDRAFEPYDPERDGERLKEALRQAGGERTAGAPAGGGASWQFAPRPHQRDMLERLAVERAVHDRARNLLVAATGTGKTVMAALDYRRLKETHAQKLRLLFVAHREEILTQSRDTYRAVLNSPDFGELFVAGQKPKQWDHVFASIQSLGGGALDSLPPDHFDVVVIDEFHHASARTYRALIDRLQPQQFLGLTATPERMDGKHVQDEYFDGRIAAELRLWEALDDDLLSPFHYFGLADDTDLSQVGWLRKSYSKDDLDKLYTGNEERAELILREVRDKVSNPETMRALGFCVSVCHAQFMAKFFRDNGIHAQALSGETPKDERRQSLRDLREGRVQVLFSVDLFNEGIDIPDVDTLLFLRPTESVTIFLQQFGRGLRRARHKEVLTVLDFIGDHRPEFPLADRLSALTNLSNRRLQHAIDQGFPLLPPGCEIVLDRKTKEVILKNIENRLKLNITQLAKEARSHGTTDLSCYLKLSGRKVEEIYGSNRSWSQVLRKAELVEEKPLVDEEALLRRLTALLHVDDPVRSSFYKRMLSANAPSYSDLSDRDQARARMLYFTLWPDGNFGENYEEALSSLRKQKMFCWEAHQVLTYALDHSEHLPRALPHEVNHLPLHVHSSYSREEILAALDQTELGGFVPAHMREGARWCANHKVDIFLATLEKKEKDYKPGVRYKDYAITSDRFHVESPGPTAEWTPAGERYQHHEERGSFIFLFVRRYKETEMGTGGPYVFLGPAYYVSHEGNKPMGITLDLDHEMPADIAAYSSTPVI